mgnify:CR=1 FL=1
MDAQWLDVGPVSQLPVLGARTLPVQGAAHRMCTPIVEVRAAFSAQHVNRDEAAAMKRGGGSSPPRPSGSGTILR